MNEQYKANVPSQAEKFETKKAGSETPDTATATDATPTGAPSTDPIASTEQDVAANAPHSLKPTLKVLADEQLTTKQLELLKNFRLAVGRLAAEALVQLALVQAPDEEQLEAVDNSAPSNNGKPAHYCFVITSDSAEPELEFMYQSFKNVPVEFNNGTSS